MKTAGILPAVFEMILPGIWNQVGWKTGQEGPLNEAAGRTHQKGRSCQGRKYPEGGQLSESSDGCGSVQ
jgi:hypothetical protein